MELLEGGTLRDRLAESTLPLSRALDMLERARHERPALLWARMYFAYHAALRTHPRWKALARRLGRAAPVRLPAS